MLRPGFLDMVSGHCCVCLCVYTRARLVDVCSLDECMFFRSVCLEGVTIFTPKRQSKADKVSNYLLWKGKY